jgi:hypothetical protein
MFFLVQWVLSFIAIKAAGEVILVRYGSGGLTIVAAALMAFLVVLVSLVAAQLSQHPSAALAVRRPHPPVSQYFVRTIPVLLTAIALSTVASLIIVMAFSEDTWEELFTSRHFITSTLKLLLVVAIPHICSQAMTVWALHGTAEAIASRWRE